MIFSKYKIELRVRQMAALAILCNPTICRQSEKVGNERITFLPNWTGI